MAKNKVTEMPHVEADTDIGGKHVGIIDLCIEKYPGSREDKERLMKAFHMGKGVVAKDKTGKWFIFTSDGVKPAPANVVTSMQQQGYDLPQDWEKYVVTEGVGGDDDDGDTGDEGEWQVDNDSPIGDSGLDFAPALDRRYSRRAASEFYSEGKKRVQLKEVFIFTEGWKDTLKAGAMAGAMAATSLGGTSSANAPPAPHPVTPDDVAISQQATPPEKTEKKEANRAAVLAALRQVESSGGKDMKHALIKSGAHAGERAIGPYAFLPSTIQELVSKSPKLKSKYGEVLDMDYGDGDQSDIEDFIKQHPGFHTDLANHYVDQIVKYTPARSVGEISDAWLFGINGYNKRAAAGKDISKTKRFGKATAAYDKYASK